VFFCQTGIDDGVTAFHFAPHPWVHDHFLRRFVHRKELAQLQERLLSRPWVRGQQHLVEHLLDEVVLGFEESYDFVRRLDKHLGHGILRLFWGLAGERGYGLHPRNLLSTRRGGEAKRLR
jgi:hypothetical protein